MSATDDSRLDEALAEARPPDPAGLALARARVASALFGTAATLGRFHVLEPLGAGGMGVVYAAYDPELDRKVALKMVNVPTGGRELAIAEGKALAKLSHPNVVPVYDVGLVEDHVYLVMELVRGPTLRDWVTDKRPREILAMYRDAGRALEAAHAEHLVHRDFKPDNAIVGADGRVRVVDFGLACETAGGEPRRVGGTPKYMAPEQALDRVTPAADQYSFCVALDEALSARGPLPRWIAAIVERGRAADPDERFPSMTELLRALARDPVKIWRWRALAAAVVGLAAAMFLIGRAHSGDDPELCAGGDRELAASWAPPTRAHQLARIANLSAYGRELAGAAGPKLDDFETRWIASYRDACLTRRSELQSDAMLDRRMTCLERGRNALATVADIASTVDANALPDLARAIAALPEPAHCSDLVALASDVAPPPRILEPVLAPPRKAVEAARVQLAAGRSKVAHDLARSAVGQLRNIGYPPLLAEALLVDGKALWSIDADAALVTLREATTVAFANGMHAVAIEAWARRAWRDGMNGKADALDGRSVVEAIAQHATGAPFARALLVNNMGSLAYARGQRAEARAAFVRALEIARDLRGPEAVERAAFRRNVARVTDDLDERIRLYRDTHEELVRLLGASHPDVLRDDFIYGATTVLEIRTAADVLGRTCPRLEQHERLLENAAECFAELGDLRDELGDTAGAMNALERATQHLAASDTQLPELSGQLALVRGDPAAALAAIAPELASRPVDPGASLFDRFLRARLLLVQARALRATGKADEARRALADSIAALGDVDERSPMLHRRRLARAHAELAAIAATRAEARDHASVALAWYRRAGGAPVRIAELERLTSSP